MTTCDVCGVEVDSERVKRLRDALASPGVRDLCTPCVKWADTELERARERRRIDLAAALAGSDAEVREMLAALAATARGSVLVPQETGRGLAKFFRLWGPRRGRG